MALLPLGLTTPLYAEMLFTTVPQKSYHRYLDVALTKFEHLSFISEVPRHTGCRAGLCWTFVLAVISPVNLLVEHSWQSA